MNIQKVEEKDLFTQATRSKTDWDSIVDAVFAIIKDEKGKPVLDANGKEQLRNPHGVSFEAKHGYNACVKLRGMGLVAVTRKVKGAWTVQVRAN